MSIYFERQRKQLCAQHALNNLLQRPAFTRHQLDSFAADLYDQQQQNEPRSWPLNTSIAASLSNPHKNPLGWGNYGIHVIEVALQSEGMEMQWIDGRKDAGYAAALAKLSEMRMEPPQPDAGQGELLVGLLINYSSTALVSSSLESIEAARSSAEGNSGLIASFRNNVRKGAVKALTVTGLASGAHWFTIVKLHSDEGEAFYNLDSQLLEPERIGNNEDVTTFLSSLKQYSDSLNVFAIVRTSQ
ncbi:hypothetical protein GQ42DRAFT_160685 [Ramicandelaber brevisporus]|nr:hypothetical protein GQ42DRAFT_160685 [Ramicandelaber brevisporus]